MFPFRGLVQVCKYCTVSSASNATIEVSKDGWFGFVRTKCKFKISGHIFQEPMRQCFWKFDHKQSSLSNSPLKFRKKRANDFMLVKSLALECFIVLTDTSSKL